MNEKTISKQIIFEGYGLYSKELNTMRNKFILTCLRLKHNYILLNYNLT